MLSYATKEEERLKRLEREKQLFPLWAVNYALAKIKEGEEIIDFEAFVNECLEPSKPQAKTKKKTAEDIMAEFMPLVEADKSRKEG